MEILVEPPFNMVFKEEELVLGGGGVEKHVF
jgi:hypothetical protein